jgi:hypothetical protein
MGMLLPSYLPLSRDSLDPDQTAASRPGFIDRRQSIPLNLFAGARGTMSEVINYTATPRATFSATAALFAKHFKFLHGQLESCDEPSRIDYGPGYRVYYTRRGKTVVILLCGGEQAPSCPLILLPAVHKWTNERLDLFNCC